LGKGEIQPSLLFTDLLKEKIDYLVNGLNVPKFKMYVHPFVEAYIKKGVFSLYGKWRREYGRTFKVIADESLAYLQYKVIDADNKEIDLKEESDAGSRQTKEKKRAKNRDNEEAE
jgi:ribonuclease G